MVISYLEKTQCNCYDLQTSLCTEEHIDCVSGIKIDNSDCLQQCSGIFVTGYDQQDEQEDKSDIRFKKLVEFMDKTSYTFRDSDMAKVFQGFNLNPLINKNILFNVGLEKKSVVLDKIAKLSEKYWNYKGFYNFPLAYKGSLI